MTINFIINLWHWLSKLSVCSIGNYGHYLTLTFYNSQHEGLKQFVVKHINHRKPYDNDDGKHNAKVVSICSWSLIPHRDALLLWIPVISEGINKGSKAWVMMSVEIFRRLPHLSPPLYWLIPYDFWTILLDMRAIGKSQSH